MKPFEPIVQVDNGNGWGQGGKPKITPEPATYGLILVAICLLILIIRRRK